MHCRVCFLGGRKGHFSPLTSALRHDPRNACPSPRLPAAGGFQSAPSATYRIQLRHYALKSRPTSPPNSSDVHAAHNLDQIEKIDEMSDAVGLEDDLDLLAGIVSRQLRIVALAPALAAAEVDFPLAQGAPDILLRAKRPRHKLTVVGVISSSRAISRVPTFPHEVEPQAPRVLFWLDGPRLHQESRDLCEVANRS